MADRLKYQRDDSVVAPARRLRSITPSDATELDLLPKSLYITTGGAIAVLAVDDDNPVTITVPNNYTLLVRARKVMATGTTATGIIALC